MITERFHPTMGRVVRGYTLLETLVSVTILAILMLAMQSVILIAVRAIPSSSSIPAATNGAGRTMDLISSDLMYATAVTRNSANDIEIVVPDRNQDGMAETIRYTWSGTAGEPLVRTYNGVSTNVVDRMQNFKLGYDKRAIELPGANTESAEVALVKHVGSGPFLYAYRINSAQCAGQYFKPTLPAEATSWRITRVTFNARINGTNAGNTKVQIRTTSSGLPTGTVLDETVLPEAALPVNFSAQSIGFTKLGGLTPGLGLCLVMQWQANADSCDIQYQTQSFGSNGTYMVQTLNGGSLWTAQSLYDIPYCVYGTISTGAPATYKYLLTNVRCTLKTGVSDQSRITTSVRVLNEPEVIGP